MADLRGIDDQLFSFHFQRFFQLFHSTVFDIPVKKVQAKCFFTKSNNQWIEFTQKKQK